MTKRQRHGGQCYPIQGAGRVDIHDPGRYPFESRNLKRRFEMRCAKRVSGPPRFIARTRTAPAD